VSDTYYETTTDTVEPDTSDTWNHIKQDDPPESGNEWNDNGQETSYYDQDHTPEDSNYYDDDHDYQETLDETRARITAQDGTQEQPGTTQSDQSEPASADSNLAPAQDDDPAVTQDTTEPAADHLDPGQGSQDGTADSGLDPAGSGQGRGPDASGLQQQPDTAPGSSGADTEPADPAGTPARQEPPDNRQSDADTTGGLRESTPLDPAAQGQARDHNPDLTSQDTPPAGDGPHSLESAESNAAESDQTDAGMGSESAMDEANTSPATTEQASVSPEGPATAAEPSSSLDETTDPDVTTVPTYEVVLHDADGHDNPLTVVQFGPEDRTLGDTSPTGIGLKPSGEQLAEMEGTDRTERGDRMLSILAKRGIDVHDGSGDIGDGIEGDLHILGSGASRDTGSIVGYQTKDANHHVEEHPNTNELAGAAALSAIVFYAAARKLIDATRRRYHE
jgi:hypothetical protein